MQFHEIIRIAETPPRADKAAVGAINRPLQGAGVVCSMASLAPTDDRFNLLKGIIAPLRVAGVVCEIP